MTRLNKASSEVAVHRSLRPVIVFLAIYALAFFALACRKHNVMNSNEGDNAAIVNFYWQTMHGRLFYSVYFGMSHLGAHASYLALLLVPVYAIIPSIYTLFFLESATIAASGLPFFLISRKVFRSELPAWLMTIAYLLYPTVVTNHVDQIGFEQLALPFLLGAVWFFMEERFWPFVACALLTMLGLENLPLTVGAFGIYALVKKRPFKWVAAPIVLAAVYGWFVFNVAMPHFTGGKGYYLSSYLGALGNSPGEAIKTCFTRPWVVVGMICSLDRLFYMLQLLQPLLWIAPFFSWEIVLVLPSLGMNLVMNESAFRVIPWHYNPTVGALLCLAAVFGAKKLAQRAEQRWRLPGVEWGLALAIAASSLASWSLWLFPSEYIAHAYFPTLKKVEDLVPPEKSVLAPSTMTAHFANRATDALLMHFDPNQPMKDRWPREKMYTLDYVILDANERRFPQEIVTRDLVMSFYTNTNYELILNENNVFVFLHRKTANP